MGGISSQNGAFWASRVILFLFQTCDDLGFSYNDKEWVQIRKMLQQKEELGNGAMVKTEDFFSAIHTIMSNKQNRKLQGGSGGPEVKVKIHFDICQVANVDRLLQSFSSKINYDKSFVWLFAKTQR